MPSNVCVHARRWWAVKRGEDGHGKGDINRTQVNGRASGVACNALLGGPGAGLKLRYMVGVARWRFSYSPHRPQRTHNAVLARSPAARTPFGRCMCSGGLNEAATQEQWDYGPDLSAVSHCSFILGAPPGISSAATPGGACRRQSAVQIYPVYPPGIYVSCRLLTFLLPHRVPRDDLAPQWKICPLDMRVHTLLGDRSRFLCRPVQRHWGKGHARPTLRVSRAAGTIVERGEEGQGKAAKVAPRSTAAPAASCCTRLLGCSICYTISYSFF